jgi:hypothetical protein
MMMIPDMRHWMRLISLMPHSWGNWEEIVMENRHKWKPNLKTRINQWLTITRHLFLVSEPLSRVFRCSSWISGEDHRFNNWVWDAALVSIVVLLHPDLNDPNENLWDVGLKFRQTEAKFIDGLGSSLMDHLWSNFNTQAVYQIEISCDHDTNDTIVEHCQARVFSCHFSMTKWEDVLNRWMDSALIIRLVRIPDARLMNWMNHDLSLESLEKFEDCNGRAESSR